ncbi:MAG: response regulator [Myxococcales bacterium]|jgi:signal transduction histidine kinase|nr:response regulator [Myxococcales bacterium]
MKTGKPAESGQRRAVVLYVDDDRANLLAFRAIAEPTYEVVVARSGDEALQLIAQNADIAVLMADQRMPGMSGIDLCERVQASHPDIVRMLVTAYSDLTAAIAAINRGHVSRYLNKPWNAEELLATLLDAVERYRLKATVQELQVRIAQSERLYALGVLTASIGHELRTPLSIVSANVQFARKALGDAIKQPGTRQASVSLQEVDAALLDAEEGAQRLIDIADSILLSSRSEPGDREPVDLAHVLHSVLRLTRSEAIHRARLLIAQSAKPRIYGSATRVGQVLLNLVLNALQALPDRPIERNEVKLSLDERDGRAIVEVADNGVGIEPGNLSHIFDPFFTTKKKGTGLGLAISKQIVEEMGGQIHVESRPGQGTRFRISWPLLTT